MNIRCVHTSPLTALVSREMCRTKRRRWAAGAEILYRLNRLQLQKRSFHTFANKAAESCLALIGKSSAIRRLSQISSHFQKRCSLSICIGEVMRTLKQAARWQTIIPQVVMRVRARIHQTQLPILSLQSSRLHENMASSTSATSRDGQRGDRRGARDQRGRGRGREQGRGRGRGNSRGGRQKQEMGRGEWRYTTPYALN